MIRPGDLNRVLEQSSARDFALVGMNRISEFFGRNPFVQSGQEIGIALVDRNATSVTHRLATFASERRVRFYLALITGVW